MKNYTKLEEKFIEEINSNVIVYKHNKTNARICTIANDDNNKVFSIAFRTPPINNGGLTHILEHSVLCGSKKYPVKDPFVELIKGSLNTFLNAFTFPDKTMYPCASQNDKDFKNLMSVYMDAVFYPQIYTHKEIFMQEGWHYHILDENDPITYNGVVYNEMKGAFSSPDGVLFENIFKSLFPDTAYGYVSGGDPKYIPDLTYEDFIAFHKKFYHPSNSYIYVYGNCDMDERLEWLDEEYLSKFNAIDFDTRLLPQKPFEAPRTVNYYYQIDENDSLDDKTFLSYNVALPSKLDTKTSLAMTILIKALFDVPGAPLKEALIKANLGADIEASFEDDLLQPILAIVAVNSNENKEEAFINIINEELKKIASTGVDKNALLSIINFVEFKTREAKFSPQMPKGIERIMTSLASWLYDDNAPYQKLETLNYFAELKEDINNGYFENLIENLILTNNHKSYIKLIPSKTCNDEAKKELEEKLDNYKKSLSKEELSALIKINKDLVEYQKTPSTPEEIATLPRLQLSDLNTCPEKLKLDVLENDYKTLFFEHTTNDVAYVKYYFDISHIASEDVLYLSLFTELLKHISTDKYSYLEINQLLQNVTGGLGFSINPYYDYAAKENKLQFVLSYSALTNNVSKANELLCEVLFKSKLSDFNRVKERINEIKAQNDMSISYRGHAVSRVRALSHIDEQCLYSDCINGIAYCDFVSNIAKDFDGKKLEDRITLLINSIFARSNVVLGFTGTYKQLEESKPTFDSFVSELPENTKYSTVEFTSSKIKEGFKAQFDVNFVARAGHFTMPYEGAMDVLANALSMDYLWQKVRVLGGAYGCMMNIMPKGVISFMSYRDPNIEKTNNTYEAVVDFIESFNPTDQELIQYKIGAMGQLDPVLHIADKAEVARNRYFGGMTYDKLKANRESIINASTEQIKGYKAAFTEALAEDELCVIGNSNAVEKSKELFDEVKSLNK